MSDDRDVVIAWVAEHLWARSSIPLVRQVVAVLLDMDQACVEGHEGVGREAVDIVEDTP